MNASAYLKGLGWRGEGFSLDHSNRGLAKPLLVSHKSDQSGLGNKKNDFGNQWWTNAFDKSLKSLGNGQPTVPIIPPSITSKRSGLYAKFVKAGSLEGTFTPPDKESSFVEEMGSTIVNGTSSSVPDSSANTRADDIAQDAAIAGATSKAEKKNKKRKRTDEERTGEVALKKKSKRAEEGRLGSKDAAHISTAAEPGEKLLTTTGGTLGDESSKSGAEESIKARRDRGEVVVLPGDVGSKDPNQLRSQLIRLYEKNNLRGVKSLLSSSFPTVNAQDPSRPNDEQAGVKKSSKAAKFDREKAKREAKQDARQWVEVRANPHLYRPDGTAIMGKKESKANNRPGPSPEEKQAKAALKKQAHAERRAIKEKVRAERKRKNLEKMEAQKSANMKAKKEKEERAQAKLRGVMPAVVAENAVSASNSDSDSDSDSDSESSDLDNDKPPLVTDPLANGDDFIPLGHIDVADDPPAPKASRPHGSVVPDPSGMFVIDTVGDASQTAGQETTPTSKPPTKKVKDMTKEERKARLEQMRARRAARKAAAAPGKLSKKERKRNRAARKEMLLNKMTNDLLSKKRSEGGQGGATDGAGGGAAPGDPVQDRKKMRREARRIMRGMKKGNVPADQIMPGWEVKGRKNKKPKLRGNGGRQK